MPLLLIEYIIVLSLIKSSGILPNSIRSVLVPIHIGLSLPCSQNSQITSGKDIESVDTSYIHVNRCGIKLGQGKNPIYAEIDAVLMGRPTNLNLPAMSTAGLDLFLMGGYSLSPFPPPNITTIVSLVITYHLYVQ